MTKYKNIEKYMPELKVYFSNITEGVLASDLEALLENGVVVYGKGTPNNFSPLQRHKSDDDNLEVLIISLKPIENQEPVSREEIEKVLAERANNFRSSDYTGILERILKQGYKP
jgi:hypothetical protein